MGKGKAGQPPGIWLKKAIKAQGESFTSTAQKLGKSKDKLDEHSQNKGKLGFDSLVELAKLYPTLNMRYILTGEGSPLLTP